MSLIIARAIRSIDPDSRFSIQSGIVDWETSPIDQSLVDAEVARLQTEYDSQEYARNRATAYAPLGEQLDMQYHDSVTGSRTWLDHVEEIKARYPK
jgi:hypothetical protein